MNSFCGSCGARLDAADRFCGACGAAVDAHDAPGAMAGPARTPAERMPPPSPGMAPSGTRGGRAALVLVATVLLFALGGGLAAVGMGLDLGGAARVDDDANALDVDAPDAPTTPDRSPADGGGVGETPTAADPAEGSDPASGGAVGAAPAGASSDSPLPMAAVSSGAETESPRTYAYASRREDCSRQTRLTDPLKGMAHEVDEAVRSGASVSRAEEDRIGREVMASFTREAGGRLDTDGRDARYLAAVGAPFVARVARTDVPYTFYVWEDTDVVNAIAIPGGHVLVSRPLLEQWIGNEAQLAAVLGHEVGHVDLRHPLAVIEAVRAVGGSADDEIARMIATFVQLPYSSVLEERADRWGGIKAHGAGYSIFQAVRLWDARAAEEGGGAPEALGDDPAAAVLGVVLAEVDNVLSTHPGAARRACLLRQVAYDMYAAHPRDAAWVGTAGWRERRALQGGR